MAYDFEARLFLENGPAIHAERARQARSTRVAKAWRQLTEDSRLAMVDQALRAPANDVMPDGLPVAL